MSCSFVGVLTNKPLQRRQLNVHPVRPQDVADLDRLLDENVGLLAQRLGSVQQVRAHTVGDKQKAQLLEPVRLNKLASSGGVVVGKLALRRVELVAVGANDVQLALLVLFGERVLERLRVDLRRQLGQPVVGRLDPVRLEAVVTGGRVGVTHTRLTGTLLVVQLAVGEGLVAFSGDVAQPHPGLVGFVHHRLPEEVPAQRRREEQRREGDEGVGLERREAPEQRQRVLGRGGRVEHQRRLGGHRPQRLSQHGRY